jgi:hypothetical protein
MSHMKHPSGRPIRRERTIGRPMWRIPDRGCVTPRLQDLPLAHPVGFVTSYLPGHQSDDDEAQTQD